MRKLIIAAMLLALLPTSTASAGLLDVFNIFKKTPQTSRQAAYERMNKSKQRFLKKMADRRARSSLSSRFAQKQSFKQRTPAAKAYTQKRSASNPLVPNR